MVADCSNADAKASAAGNRSRDDCGACSLRYCFGLARDHGLVHIGGALNDDAISRNTGPGPDESDVANAQLGEWDSMNVSALYAFSSVWEQGRERIECATSLGNGPHF